VVNAGLGKENQYGEGDSWQDIIDTNLTGSYNTIHECLPYLRAEPDSYRKVIFMSSILARYGAPGYSAYCASKAGVLGLMRSFAAELGREKILVNAICPSWVETQMAHSFFENMARAIGISKDEVHQGQMRDAPLGKISTTGEIARLVGFLMSDAESSITGQAIDINNGILMV
jgi:NAD(P)-dependent dehydrogenase (short-subunit alcohol dehydrogenase family)